MNALEECDDDADTHQRSDRALHESGCFCIGPETLPTGADHPNLAGCSW